MKILGRANSINVRKVLWLAEELGLKYERADFGRGFTPTDVPEFTKYSAFGVIPVLIDDGFVLRESNTIVRYLAAKHGADNLYPKDLEARAIIEQWMDWSITQGYTVTLPVFHGLVTKLPPFNEPAKIEAGIKDWGKQLALLDTHLAKHGPYLTGTEFTIADIPVGLTVNRWYSIDFNQPDLPAVAAYYDRLTERPAYKAHGRNGTP